MNIVGCTVHTRFQQSALLNMETGEWQEKRLYHEGKEVETFYGTLEASGRSGDRAHRTLDLVS